MKNVHLARNVLGDQQTLEMTTYLKQLKAVMRPRVYRHIVNLLFLLPQNRERQNTKLGSRI